MKKILAISLTLSKVFLLVLLSSMNMWGNSAMAMEMPCGKMMEVEKSKCEICALAVKDLSNPFVQRVEKKEIKEFAGFKIPQFNFIEESIVLNLKTKKYIFPPPKLLTKNSYLFAKEKIVLVI